MTTSLSDTKVLWFDGQPQVARYSNGVLGAYSDPMNAMKLSIKHSSKAYPILASGGPHRGQIAELPYWPEPTEVEFELDLPDRRMLADCVLGDIASTSVSAATDKTISLTLVNGEWVQLYDAMGNPIRNIDNPAITGKTLGTDFLVNKRSGQVKALNTSAAGDKTLTYDLVATSGYRITAGTKTHIEFSLQMESHNNDGFSEEGFLWIPKISAMPDSALDLVSTKNQSIKFKGYVVLVKGPDGVTDLAPYTLDPLSVAA